MKTGKRKTRKKLENDNEKIKRTTNDTKNYETMITLGDDTQTWK